MDGGSTIHIVRQPLTADENVTITEEHHFRRENSSLSNIKTMETIYVEAENSEFNWGHHQTGWNDAALYTQTQCALLTVLEQTFEKIKHSNTAYELQESNCWTISWSTKTLSTCWWGWWTEWTGSRCRVGISDCVVNLYWRRSSSNRRKMLFLSNRRKCYATFSDTVALSA